MSDIKNEKINNGKTEDAVGHSDRRRRLLKGVATAAPIIMTVVHKPVMASHCTISGALSGNLSTPTDDHICVGLTPGYWGQHPNEWLNLNPQLNPGSCTIGWAGPHCKKNEYESDGTMFHDLTLGFSGNMYSGLTMMQVIHLTGVDDSYQLGAHAAAALCNAIRFQSDPYLDFGYTPQDIRDMWAARSNIDPEGLKQDYQLLNERGA